METEDQGWKRLQLNPGDLLVIAPGTKHRVFNPVSCVATGRHFYSHSMLARLLQALREEADHPSLTDKLVHEALEVWVELQHALTSSNG